MPNEYYDHTTYPAQGVAGSSAALRAELDSIEAGFAKLPTLAGNGGEIVVVNAGGTALESVASLTVAQGGTGRVTGTTAYGLIAAGTTATGAQQTLAAGLTTEILVGGGASALPVWTAATGTGAPVRATSPTLVAPVLGVATATSVNGVRIGAPSSFSIYVGNSVPSWSGVTNTAFGHSSLAAETTGINNVALGMGALAGQNGKDANVGIGRNAGSDISGSNNVAVGYNAGTSMSGNNNIAIGDSAQNDGVTPLSGSNNTVIGYQAKTATQSTSNSITLGNSSITTLRCQVTSITSLSDIRDKTDIVPLATGLATVMALKPVRFTWNMRDGGKVGITDSGFIAQDLQAVDDCWLNLVYAENPEKLEASYGRLIPVLVRAIQELKAEVDTLRAAQQG